MASKSFRRLKKEAIAHWQKNLKLIDTMDWSKWVSYDYGERVGIVLHVSERTEGYPFIGGRECTFCDYFAGHNCTHEIETSDNPIMLTCPLKPKRGTVKGNCCPEWLAVREALCLPHAKEKAIETVQAMINRIKEIPDDYGTEN